MTDQSYWITVAVNRQPREIPSGMSILTLLEDMALPETGIAVAINQTVVVADHWSSTVLQRDDDIQVFQAIAGG